MFKIFINKIDENRSDTMIFNNNSINNSINISKKFDKYLISENSEEKIIDYDSDRIGASFRISLPKILK